MDGRRIKNFNAEFIELSIVHSALIGLRGLVSGFGPRGKSYEMGRLMEAMKDDIMENVGMYGRLKIVDGDDGVSDLGIRLAGRIIKPQSRSRRRSTQNAEDAEVEEGCMGGRYTKEQVIEVDILARRIDGVLRDILGGGVVGIERGIKDVAEGLERVLGDLLVGEEDQSSPILANSLSEGSTVIIEDDELPVNQSMMGERVESQDEMFRRLRMIISLGPRGGRGGKGMGKVY